ncbi:MAG: ion transporter [Gemmatimonadota bacterium]|nr:ion transporter [Gemmatimonadota bacterium]MDH3368780.1 ion transporter [Gemmatimonadota bacterium]MDH3479694.1 ion transporter [Gemmatimonadota bacterium]MDH3570790.1 ion transporter [Gemmatimonadota bacterium]MDH5549822.1 ion transporter [Gemmatimonadota bacterium]
MSQDRPLTSPAETTRERVHRIIFGHDTPAGKAFDVVLILAIVASVVVVMLDSVQAARLQYGTTLRALEWIFTILFTVEYVVRLWCVPRAIRYARSFFGVVDLLAILPTYLSLFIPGGQALLSVRALRLLRIFRILKLGLYVSEAAVLMRALRQSRQKITVFIAAVLTLVVVMGSMMYLVEGTINGFTSIPRSVYWAIVTLTTVGYGDIAPRTNLGQALAAVIMIMGYAIIAVPTGIVTVELGNVVRRTRAERVCQRCQLAGHDPDAVHCKRCGDKIGVAKSENRDSTIF